jgi:hypothetical protein
MPRLTQSERAFLYILACALGAFSLALVWLAVSTGTYVVLLAIPAIFLMPFAIVAFFHLLPVAIHEGGHYVAGRAVGYRFKGVVVGPFSWIRSKEGIEYKFDRYRLHGLMLMELVPGRTSSRLQQALFVAGGPAANLAAAVLCLIWGLEWLPTVSHARVLILMQAFCNGVFFLGILSKRQVAGHVPDRVLLARILDKMQVADAVKLIESNGTDQPRSWDAAAIRVLSTPPGPPEFDVWAYGIVFHHHLDSGRLDDAEKYLAAGLKYARKLSILRSDNMVDLLLEGAAYFAGRRGDCEKARALLNHVGKCAPHFFPTARRALIALDYAEGRRERGDRRLQRALTAARRSTAPGNVTECHYLELVREWCIETAHS